MPRDACEEAKQKHYARYRETIVTVEEMTCERPMTTWVMERLKGEPSLTVQFSLKDNTVLEDEAVKQLMVPGEGLVGKGGSADNYVGLSGSCYNREQGEVWPDRTVWVPREKTADGKWLVRVRVNGHVERMLMERNCIDVKGRRRSTKGGGKGEQEANRPKREKEGAGKKARRSKRHGAEETL